MTLIPFIHLLILFFVPGKCVPVKEKINSELFLIEKDPKTNISEEYHAEDPPTVTLSGEWNPLFSDEASITGKFDPRNSTENQLEEGRDYFRDVIQENSTEAEKSTVVFPTEEENRTVFDQDMFTEKRSRIIFNEANFTDEIYQTTFDKDEPIERRNQTRFNEDGFLEGRNHTTINEDKSAGQIHHTTFNETGSAGEVYSTDILIEETLVGTIAIEEEHHHNHTTVYNFMNLTTPDHPVDGLDSTQNSDNIQGFEEILFSIPEEEEEKEINFTTQMNSAPVDQKHLGPIFIRQHNPVEKDPETASTLVNPRQVKNSANPEQSIKNSINDREMVKDLFNPEEFTGNVFDPKESTGDYVNPEEYTENPVNPNKLTQDPADPQQPTEDTSSQGSDMLTDKSNYEGTIAKSTKEHKKIYENPYGEHEDKNISSMSFVSIFLILVILITTT
ncbi:hypothetical protein FO519_002270 [Halicephalobus sp. NKZ332]|nr:hypothetical protein FO519_002270 [Halicephalobus sp. NKZ332]